MLLRLPEALLPKGFTPGTAIHIIKKPAAKLPINEAGLKDKTPYREARLAQKNRGDFWTDEQDETLRRLFHNGVRLGALAAHFRCKPTKIVVRLKQLGCLGEV